MGTEILRPQDCLIERIRVPQPAVFYRRRNYGNPNFNYPNTRSSRKPAVRQEKPEKKRYVTTVEPSVSKRSSSADDLRVAKTGPAMEKVTILRRGESLDSKIKSESRKEAFCYFPLSSLFFCWGFFVCFWQWYLFILQQKAQTLQFKRSKAMGSLAIAIQEKEERRVKRKRKI